MEDDHNFSKMEDYLNFFKNERQPQYFQNGRRPELFLIGNLNFFKIEDNLIAKKLFLGLAKLSKIYYLFIIIIYY